VSQVADLLAGRSTGGVPFRALGELLEYEQPTKYLVESKEYRDDYPTPVLTAGRTFVLGHTNECEGIYPASAESPVIIFDDFTTAFKWVTFEFKAKSSAMKMLTLRNDAPVTLRYVYYAMRNIDFEPQSHARHWIGTYSKFRIPIPSPEIQDEIVAVLDDLQEAVGELETELDREISARRTLNTHCRELTFDRLKLREPEWATLPDIAANHDSKRKPVTRAARTPGAIPYYGASGVVDYVEDFIFDGEYLLVSEDGANLLARSSPIAFSVHGKSWVNNHAHVLEFPGSIERKYVECYLNSIDLSPYVTGGAQAKLSQANLNRIPIPIPTSEEQERVVLLLDALHSQVEELVVELSSERVARRKQYEFCRSELFTFAEANQ
jgi:type I restriction enzyme S subunit